MKKVIKFALAVDHNGLFHQNHFGNASKYMVYEWRNNELIYLKEINNPFKSFDEEQEHGVHKKGMAIIRLLQSMGVKSLVSKQFGQNIQLVNSYFAPVIINAETPNEVLPVLSKHIQWIEEELNSKSTGFKLFTIKKGIIKIVITNEIN